MEIIREEEISSKLRKTFRKKSKVYENDNKSPIRRPTVAAAIIVTNKLTSNKEKKQQPILLSSNLVTNTHINFDNESFNNDSSFFNNQQPRTMSRASISSENNPHLKSNEDFYSNQPASSMFDYLKLPKRNPPIQKISQTFKSVVNSLIAERLLNYSKEYDFNNDDKNPVFTTNGFSQNDSNFGDSSSTNSKVFTNDGSSLTSSSLNMNVNNINNNKGLNRNKATSFPSKFAQKRSIIEQKITSTNSTSKTLDQMFEQQNIKKEIKFNKESTLLSINNLDIKTKFLNRSKTMNTMKLSKVSKPILTKTIVTADSPTSSNSSLKTPPIIRPITSTVVRNKTNNISERKTESSTLVRRQAIKKKNNEEIVQTNGEEKNNDNDDACSYASASDIFVKSRSSENFNLKPAQSKVVGNEKRVLVSALKNPSRQQQQHEPPVTISIRETPQYHGRWTDLAVNYYLDHEQEEEDNDHNSRYNSRYQNFSSDNSDDYNYVSSIFKIRRYNLNDSVELGKAKQDLFKRYSFINDPYIKSRLTNLSGLSMNNNNSPMRSNMSTTPSSSRLSVIVNDRKN